MSVLRVEYAIEFLEADDRTWTELYRTDDRADLDDHWRRLAEIIGPPGATGRPTRAVQVDVLIEEPAP